MTTDTKEVSDLKFLHQTQVSVEKFRVALGNRVWAIEAGRDPTEGTVPPIYKDLHGLAESMETLLDKEIAKALEAYPVWRSWLKDVKGIGPGLAGQMLALLLPPLADRGPSTWYKAAGLYSEERVEADGTPVNRLPRARVGEGKVTYHRWLRRCLWNAATSFVRNGGYYRQVYEQRKAALSAQHAGDSAWPPYRLDSVARWITIKLFLAHLWEKWCEAESIEGRRAYVVEKLGHHYVAPPERNGGGKI